MLAATAQAAEIAELNRKLRLSDEELDCINKRFKKPKVCGISVYSEFVFMCSWFVTG